MAAGAGERLGGSPDWASAGHEAHLVQFYEHESTLIERLGPFMGTAIVRGDAALLIATRAHRTALLTHLRQRGLDTAIAETEGRFAWLDAHETLKVVTGPAGPDRAKLERLIGPTLARLQDAASGPTRRVVVFGEMVALLWAERKPDQALALEEMWGDYLETHRLTLCCAYPMEIFRTGNDPASFLRVCAQHTHVFPAPGAHREQPAFPRR